MQFHPSISITEVSDEKIQVSGIGSAITIEGHNHALKSIVRQIEQGVPIEAIESCDESGECSALIAILTEHKALIVDDCAKFSDDLADLDLSLISQRNASASNHGESHRPQRPDIVIDVRGAGQLSLAVSQTLKGFGFHIMGSCDAGDMVADLMVCCGDQPVHDRFGEWNQEAIEKRVPVLFGFLEENRAIVGPFVIPAETACFDCFRHRVISNINYIEEGLTNQNFKGNVVCRRGVPKQYALMTSFYLASQILKYIHGDDHYCFYDEIMDINHLDHSQQKRPVLKLPRCHSCSHSGPIKAIRNMV